MDPHREQKDGERSAVLQSDDEWQVRGAAACLLVMYDWASLLQMNGRQPLLASGEAAGSSSSAANAAEAAKPKKGTWLDTLHMNPKMYWPKKYRYTVEPTPGSVAVLSVKERDHYESNGYIIVRNLLPREAQQQLNKLLTSPESLDQALTLFANAPQVSTVLTQGDANPSSARTAAAPSFHTINNGVNF